MSNDFRRVVSFSEELFTRLHVTGLKNAKAQFYINEDRTKVRVVVEGNYLDKKCRFNLELLIEGMHAAVASIDEDFIVKSFEHYVMTEGASQPANDPAGEFLVNTLRELKQPKDE